MITKRDQLQERKEKRTVFVLRTALPHTRIHSKLWSARITLRTPISQQELADKVGVTRKAGHLYSLHYASPKL